MNFTEGIDRLLNQVGHWEPSRWTAPATTGEGSRADQAHALTQELADLAADADGRPRRKVPDEGPLVLADQIRVLADDLLRAEPSDATLATAVAAVTRVRQAL